LGKEGGLESQTRKGLTKKKKKKQKLLPPSEANGIAIQRTPCPKVFNGEVQKSGFVENKEEGNSRGCANVHGISPRWRSRYQDLKTTQKGGEEKRSVKTDDGP